MRFAGEPLLPATSVRIGEARQPVGWLGDRQQIVGYGSGNGVQLQQKSLLAALDVGCGRSIAKSEAVRFVDYVENAAEVERPEPKRMRFDGDDLLRLDRNFGVCDSHPAEVELPPLPKGEAGRREGLRSVADFGAHVVPDVAFRYMKFVRPALGVAWDAVAAGQIPRDLKPASKRRLLRPEEGEHEPQYGMKLMYSSISQPALFSHVLVHS